jgi:hypothetical protein
MEMLRLAIEGSIVQLGMSLSNLISSNRSGTYDDNKHVPGRPYLIEGSHHVTSTCTCASCRTPAVFASYLFFRAPAELYDRYLLSSRLLIQRNFGFTTGLTSTSRSVHSSFLLQQSTHLLRISITRRLCYAAHHLHPLRRIISDEHSLAPYCYHDNTRIHTLGTSATHLLSSRCQTKNSLFIRALASYCYLFCLLSSRLPKNRTFLLHRSSADIVMLPTALLLLPSSGLSSRAHRPPCCSHLTREPYSKR